MLLLLSGAVLGQGGDLVRHLEELKKQLGEVKADKKTYRQEVSYTPEQPYRLNILTEETDSKGKSIKRRAVLNLGAMDKNLVGRENSKDLMWVSARSGSLPVIKTYEDEVLGDYSSVLELYCKDVDNARAVEEALKAAIPLADAAWRKTISLPTELPALRSWLVAHVQNIDAGDVTLKQALVLDDKHPAQTWLTFEEYDKKGLKKAEKFGWDLGDLHEPSVKAQVRRKQVMVEADIRQKQEFVSVEQDGKKNGFARTVSIATEDVDQAQLLVLALQTAIPLARTASEHTLPKATSLQDGLHKLSQLVQNFTINQENHEQSLTAAQVATYSHRTAKEKGTTEEQYIFNFADLSEPSVSIETSKQVFLVEATTAGKQSLIEVRKDGEQQNYTQKLALQAPDLATAKQMQHLLRYIIKSSSNKEAPHDLAWLRTSLAGFDERQVGVQQKLEIREGSTCKVALSVRKESNKKVDEYLYEFNLYDIDADKVSLKVKGKNVEVAVPTRFGEELIKEYTNGDKIKYAKETTFAVPGIATGKSVVATLQKLVRDCPKK
ncbi:hypothetical protein GCM10027291_22870 [Telluribacter humicola]